MVLTRAQRARVDREIDAAIEGFLAARAVAVSAPPSEDPIPVVDLSDSEEEEVIVNDVDEEMEALFMEIDNWGEDNDEGDVDDAVQGNVDEGDACIGDEINDAAQGKADGKDIDDGESVGEKGPVMGVSEDAKGAAKRRLDCVGEELAMLRKEINDELNATGGIDGSDKGGPCA